jgi:hypothetical protein
VFGRFEDPAARRFARPLKMAEEPPKEPIAVVIAQTYRARRAMGRGPIDVVEAGLRNTWLVNTVRDSDARATDPLKVPGAEIAVVSESRHLHPWRCHPDPLRRSVILYDRRAADPEFRVSSKRW